MKYIILLCLLAASVGAADLSSKEIVAATILGEAGNQGQVGMRAVACVIANRATERRLTAAGVCLQAKQFSCNNNGVQAKLLKSKNAQYALDLAAKINTMDTSLVKGANHYCTTSINPYWSKGKTPVVTIGAHKFFKL